MWARSIDNPTSSCILPGNLNSRQYRSLLHRHLPGLLYHVSLHKQSIQYSHDNAPAHFMLASWDWLCRHYHGWSNGVIPQVPISWSRDLNLLAPELFFLILAHSVYKMWIIQEPNKLELWNKLHFKEKKWRVYIMFKIFGTYICWINI
jgi:hypothetical protein